MSEQIDVQITVQYESASFDAGKVREVVEFVCEKFSVTRADIGIAITDDKGIEKVHKEFLGKKTATDVISFDLSDAEESKKTFELIVNAELAEREALSRQHSAQAELALYVVHGLLHNLGFDDGDEAVAEKMHKAEDDILQQCGYGITYTSG